MKNHNVRKNVLILHMKISLPLPCLIHPIATRLTSNHCYWLPVYSLNFLLFMLLQLSPLFPHLSICIQPLVPPPEAIITTLSMSMGPAYMFFHYFLTNVLDKKYIILRGRIKMFMFGRNKGIGV